MVKVELDNDKIVYRIDSVEIQILWNEIIKICYYKYDFITHEKACLLFNYNFGEFVEIFENVSGWRELISNLHLHLPVKKDWCKELEQLKLNDAAVEIYSKE